MDYFAREMQQLLAAEYDDFLRTEGRSMYRSLRLNPPKTTFEELSGSGIKLGERTLFDDNAFYIDEEEADGLHPFHLAGLYYLQEPSAASAVRSLQVKPGHKVLDLCAAPGGKSTQILSDLQGKGLLWTNEISFTRSQKLLANIERWGWDNYVLTNAEPALLAERLYGWFDRVLVDAPCSGASMFKKYPQTRGEYSAQLVEMNHQRQLEILESAYRLLAADGIMVYSTCTYNTRENEETVAAFLNRHPEMELIEADPAIKRRGFTGFGIDERKVARVLPMDGGEGHFAAAMFKRETCQKARIPLRPFTRNAVADRFFKEHFRKTPNYAVVDDRVYLSEESLPQFSSHLLRSGILAGEIVNGRFEPHHHLFVSRYAPYFEPKAELDEKNVQRYLKGETLPANGLKGHVAICFQGHSLGFGKADGRLIKNKYPKGLRLK